MKKLGTDNIDYHLLTEGIGLISNVAGMTCEIGLREGGGSQFIMDAINNTKQQRTHIAIDPYGNIIAEAKDNEFRRFDWDNNMRNICLSNMYQLASELNINFLFFQLEDTEFFNRYADGVPIYNEVKSIENLYAFVFFDGPHGTQAVIKEFEFFNARANSGAVFVFDDISYYDFALIEKQYLGTNWELVNKTTTKASYKKK
jgi:hypothetical protein